MIGPSCFPCWAGVVTFVGLPNEGACDFAVESGCFGVRWLSEMLGVLGVFSCFTLAFAAGFDSEYCEIKSLTFSSCSCFSAPMGIFGDPRNKLEFSTRTAGLVASPVVPAGGVDEPPRPSRPFRSWAFSSAALAFICVTGRGGAGLAFMGWLKGEGENWHTQKCQ
ncbi:uncharacterized protein K444DRAFT_426740 [Hyaloscypha bicolor E]|jgi:hypothetical protein|uniref:Uncharacterized protein n=1 Tax=Hyaloscypha bicolor E TaxID=1095630 RepID=A0A2J6T838_9HELO|nr:uncharacterized protein K444DRAFT_426740 [Hyaloscypha bicolor E]PMD59184.1 hypothetical protein K444DRAFT_426740 [Hyaloscypha bicolor E]